MDGLLSLFNHLGLLMAEQQTQLEALKAENAALTVALESRAKPCAGCSDNGYTPVPQEAGVSSGKN